MTQNAELRQVPKSYVIDVCVVCGAHAIWPFSCGHQSTSEAWAAPIVVAPSRSTRRAVQFAIDMLARQPEITA